MNTKRLIALILAAVMALALAACADTSAKNDAENKTEPSAAPTENAQIPNPWQDYDSLADAEKAAGFELSLPESLPADAVIQVMEKQTVQVIYTKDGNEYIIRKGVGSSDISGDYSDYAESSSATVDGVDVTMKGSDGTISLAIWVVGDYSYSVGVESGISAADMTAIVAAVK